jgi:hypothetical protein
MLEAIKIHDGNSNQPGLNGMTVRVWNTAHVFLPLALIRQQLAQMLRHAENMFIFMNIVNLHVI